MTRYVVAIDQGTTGSTVLVLDEKLEIRGKQNQEFAQIYPKPGWVEHDPDAIWKSVLVALERALAEAKVAAKDSVAIGITNHRETAVVWARATGAPAPCAG
jgi:glycerol kinase